MQKYYLNVTEYIALIYNRLPDINILHIRRLYLLCIIVYPATLWTDPTV